MTVNLATPARRLPFLRLATPALGGAFGDLDEAMDGRGELNVMAHSATNSMLRYLNSGKRQFGPQPFWAHKRPDWEFYAVLKGRCGVLLKPPGKNRLDEVPMLRESAKLPLKESHFWVFPPQHDHGWHGELYSTCEVAEFHFSRVPQVLEDAMRGHDFLEHALTGRNRKQIEAMVRALEPDYRHPTLLSNLRSDQVLLELTLLLLADMGASTVNTAEQRASEKVNAAIRWFSQHLRERPSFEDVASAVHISPTHLRRLFARIRKESPRHAMKRIQLEAASRLLAESDDKLDFIACECGFSSASDFCRTFKAYRGCSPTQWRTLAPAYSPFTSRS